MGHKQRADADAESVWEQSKSELELMIIPLYLPELLFPGVLFCRSLVCRCSAEQTLTVLREIFSSDVRQIYYVLFERIWSYQKSIKT